MSEIGQEFYICEVAWSSGKLQDGLNTKKMAEKKSKPRIIKDYGNLSDEIKEQLKLVYPLGFAEHLVTYMTKDGEKRKGLPFETEDAILLVKMTVAWAEAIIEDDEDYDAEGNLKSKVRTKYEDKYDDLDFIKELNSNDDNEFDDEEGGPLEEDDDFL